MITKDDDKGDDKKLKNQSKNNSSELNNISIESRTSQELKKRIKKNSRLKKKA